MKKKALFIVNPISGGKDKSEVIAMIKAKAPAYFDLDLFIWEKKEQRTEMLERIRKGNYHLVVAAGGDGTINQVAQALLYSQTQLGIIPLGSGNGLARHLQLPLNSEKALERIAQGSEKIIDVCSINDAVFCCTSGMGFDANISQLFAESPSRGFWTYFKLTVGQFLRYKVSEYELNIEGRKMKRDAFLITCANASQYGNNAYIAPQADISDGLLDVVILKPFKFWNMPQIGIRMFNKTLPASSFIECYKTASVTITRQQAAPVHYDGEPDRMGERLEVKVLPAALKVLV